MQVIRNAIAEGSCLLNLRAQSMREILKAAVEHLVQTGRLPEESKAPVLEGLISRERVVPSAIGHSCAIPHLYTDGVPEPTLVFIRLKRPINLAAPDRVATRFVFLLLGPEKRASEHLDTISSIARLMSDDDFHYDAVAANSHQEIVESLRQYVLRSEAQLADKPRTESPSLAGAHGMFTGLVQDFRRRLAVYASDFRDGIDGKSLASVLFLFFACLAPAITFGGIMGDATGGAIGTVEMLVATGICGIFYAMTAGQPLIILGGIGPLLIFTMILYRLCDGFGLSEHFLTVYAWTGLWTGLFLVILSVTNSSNLMKYFTRFTDEIFSSLMSLIFIYEAIRALINVFGDSFAKNQAHDRAFLTLILAMGTFYVATSLSHMRSSHYLHSRAREFLADFGPSIALVMMSYVAWLLRDKVIVDGLNVGSGLGTTSGRAWMVDLWAAPVWVCFASAAPAVLAGLLIYLSQNITARLVNSPDNRLKKGEAYHLDLFVVGLLVGGCSLFGLPWLVAATVRSLAHVRALASVEEIPSGTGTMQERITHVSENRVTGLVIHVLILASLLVLPLMKLVPMGTLYGIFLFMGVVSLAGNQFIERIGLLFREPALYPAAHYIRRVPVRTIHVFTAIQTGAMIVLCMINLSQWEGVRILFPVFIALLVPLRWMMDRMFSREHLQALDADEVPESEQTHWL